MRSLTILVSSFLFTLTLAFPTDIDIGFRLVSVSKENHSDQTALALRQATFLPLQKPELLYLAPIDYNHAQNFTISFNGGISEVDPNVTVGAVSKLVHSEDVNIFLPFVDAKVGERPAGSYCVKINPEILVKPSVPEVEYSYTYTLALAANTELFALCETNTTGPGSAVMYNASSTASGYNCTPVDIFLVLL